MKIFSLDLENYTCHKKTSIPSCSTLHVLVGRNSSGKSSILKSFELIKDYNELEATKLRGKVFGGVKSNEDKEIRYKIGIELSNDERKRYLFDYFRLSPDLADNTSILKKIFMHFSVAVAGEKIARGHHHNRIILKKMEITDTQAKLVTILREHDSYRNKLNLATFQKGGQIPEFNQQYAAIDSYLRHVMDTNKTPVDADALNTVTSMFQYDFLRDFIDSFHFIDSSRETSKEVEYESIDPTQVDSRGSNLINSMNTMYSKDSERYQEIEQICKRIFPDIKKIHPEPLTGKSITLVIEKSDISNKIGIYHEASGLDQLLIIIWKIATAEPGSIWLLDEPELHLHPGAQQVLYNFLREESIKGKQIIIATHSMVFMHNSDFDEVTLVLYEHGVARVMQMRDLLPGDEELCTPIGRDIVRKHIYDALGYDPTFAFEPRTVVITEGQTDGKILPIFSEILERPLDPVGTRFIPLGNSNNVEKYTPAFAFTVLGKKCLIVLDNDNEEPHILKNKIIRKEIEYKNKIDGKPLLNDSNFHLYHEHVYSIEYYLLEIDAIVKAAGIIDHHKRQEMEERLSSQMDAIMAKTVRPKEVLRGLWEDFAFKGPYHEVDTAVTISRHLSKDHLENNRELVNLIEAMRN